MRIIKARYLTGVVIDLKDSIESLKWLINNKVYLSGFWYEITNIEKKYMKVKYPRTKHLPWSKASTKDDRYLANTDCFTDKRVIVTLKTDGENTTLYADGSYHARSVDSKSDESRDWLHSWWANKIYTGTFMLMYKKYPNIRFCAENMYAKHTIHYKNLKSLLLIHSIWNGDTCLSWKEVESICSIMDLTTVPLAYDGLYDETAIHKLDDASDYLGDPIEGYVVRNAESFSYTIFAENVAKYVRPDFVIGEEKHWFQQQREKNELRI